MSDKDWVDKLLREALEPEKPKKSHYQEFEDEFDGIKKGMVERKGRAIICAAAALGAATLSLRIASNLPFDISEKDEDLLRQTVLFLAHVLTKDQYTYLPAILAAVILRKADTDDH